LIVLFSNGFFLNSGTDDVEDPRESHIPYVTHFARSEIDAAILKNYGAKALYMEDLERGVIPSRQSQIHGQFSKTGIPNKILSPKGILNKII
jgi:hypothetical protein